MSFEKEKELYLLELENGKDSKKAVAKIINHRHPQRGLLRRIRGWQQAPKHPRQRQHQQSPGPLKFKHRPASVVAEV